jgi:protein phosphatase
MSSATDVVAIGHCTDPGPREKNEDAVREVSLPGQGWLLAVADGMGGLEAGEVASRLALDVLEQRITAGSALTQAVRSANAALHQRAGGQSMGTTLVVALAEDGAVRIANVGDSRAYYIDFLGITQITADHTVAGEAAVSTPGAGEQVASTRWGGTLTRALGMEANVEVDEFGPMNLGEGSWLVLCTDGVYKAVSDQDIEECVVEGRGAEDAAQRLVGLALERGTQDNATAAVVRLPRSRGSLSPGATPTTPSTPWDPGRFLIPSGEGRLKRKATFLVLALSTILVAILVASVIFLI